MAHEHHVPRLPQQLPGVGLSEKVGGRSCNANQGERDLHEQVQRNGRQ
jgi:hypothetical protein